MFDNLKSKENKAACSSNLWCVDVINNFNKMPIVSSRWILNLRPINSVWLILAIWASAIISPEIARAQPPAQEKTPPLSVLKAENLSSQTLKSQVVIPSNSVVVDTIGSKQDIAQTPAPATPSATPSPSTPNPSTPVNPSVPTIPAPGTEGIPQQETPNQLEF